MNYLLLHYLVELAPLLIKKMHQATAKLQFTINLHGYKNEMHPYFD